MREAETALAQAFADGYKITDTAIGGNDRVLLTVYTLHPVNVALGNAYKMFDPIHEQES